jgi:hypothetical protein
VAPWRGRGRRRGCPGGAREGPRKPRRGAVAAPGRDGERAEGRFRGGARARRRIGTGSLAGDAGGMAIAGRPSGGLERAVLCGMGGLAAPGEGGCDRKERSRGSPGRDGSERGDLSGRSPSGNPRRRRPLIGVREVDAEMQAAAPGRLNAGLAATRSAPRARARAWTPRGCHVSSLHHASSSQDGALGRARGVRGAPVLLPGGSHVRGCRRGGWGFVVTLDLCSSQMLPSPSENS